MKEKYTTDQLHTYASDLAVKYITEDLKDMMVHKAEPLANMIRDFAERDELHGAINISSIQNYRSVYRIIYFTLCKLNDNSQMVLSL